MEDDAAGVGLPKFGGISGDSKGEAEDIVGDCGGPIEVFDIVPMPGGQRGSLCAIPGANSSPLLSDVPVWGEVEGPNMCEGDGKGDGRGLVPTGGIGDLANEDGNAPGGGGLDANGGGGPVGLTGPMPGGYVVCAGAPPGTVPLGNKPGGGGPGLLPGKDGGC